MALTHLPKGFASTDMTAVPAGIKLADLPQDSDDSDDAEALVPVEGMAGLSPNQAEAEKPAGAVDDSSDSGSEGADEAVSSGDEEEKKVNCQAVEHASLQTQAD